MAGIVGINRPNSSDLVRKALEKIAHRGKNGPVVYELDNATHGQVWAEGHQMHAGTLTRHGVLLDGAISNWGRLHPTSTTVHHAIEGMYSISGPGFVVKLDGPFALVIGTDRGSFIARDALGVAPLYTGSCDGDMCFASEIKALLGWAKDIREFPPGHYYDPNNGLVCFHKISQADPEAMPSEDAAVRLRKHLMKSVAKRIAISENVGSWLSGGLDSSAIAAIACKQYPLLKTFAVGIQGAPDLEHARVAADFIKSDHYELIIGMDDILRALPDVIYHLESFDALLVRSSIVNYLVGKLASDHVSSAFSGEGGDELFAGYEYLKALDPSKLAGELVDITNRLHNTALQRVDRCSAAHGLSVHTAFLDRDVVDFALRTPPEYKLRRNGHMVEKWILRQAVHDLLPDDILNRRKAKFWEGAGVADMLEQHASKTISDEDFARERRLPDGSLLNTKEELFNYRIFKDHFGELDDLSFVGRTKGAPVTSLA